MFIQVCFSATTRRFIQPSSVGMDEDWQLSKARFILIYIVHAVLALINTVWQLPNKLLAMQAAIAVVPSVP